MSVRPRPVTATFKPACMQPPGIRPRAYSLSSGGSTESLVSVLDHGSVDDLLQQFSDDEEGQQQQQKQVKILASEKREKTVKRHRSRKESDFGSQTNLSNKTFTRLGSRERDSGKENHEVSESSQNLSCWEVWLLEKAKEERARLEREARVKHRQAQQERKQKEKEERKKEVSDRKYREWLEKVKDRQQRQDKGKSHEDKVKKDIEEAKKSDIEQQSKEKFEKWLANKKNQEKEAKRKKKEVQKKKEEEKQTIRERSDEAYLEWLEKAKHRPRSAHHSFGYTAGGKLTGYFDNTAPPVPSYYNPVPWQHVEVPRPKTNRTPRPKSAYRWNPNKYL